MLHTVSSFISKHIKYFISLKAYILYFCEAGLWLDKYLCLSHWILKCTKFMWVLGGKKPNKVGHFYEKLDIKMFSTIA